MEKAFASAETPSNRDTVRDAPDTPAPFAYRTPDEVLRRLPEPAATLLRRLDDAATSARDTTVAITQHINAAYDRLAVRRTDLAATLRAARRHDLETEADARRVLASSPESRNWGPAERAHAEAIVRAAERCAEVEGEIARLRERLHAHNAVGAPLTALRNRLADAAARLRPPMRELVLPEIDARKAERVLREARAEMEDARAEIAAIEAAMPTPADAERLAREAVALHARNSGLRSAVRWDGRVIAITEPFVSAPLEDRAPLRPLALLCAIAPDQVARAIADAIGSDPAAPPVADRPRLIAEARSRLRAAELRERAALRAMGDPLEMFRPDTEAHVSLMLEGER
ncbi:MAG: hypothetical protein NZM07_05175 [Elioraea sp.]|nr:hypothetical protein [Elioraea sp.]